MPLVRPQPSYGCLICGFRTLFSHIIQFHCRKFHPLPQWPSLLAVDPALATQLLDAPAATVGPNLWPPTIAAGAATGPAPFLFSPVTTPAPTRAVPEPLPDKRTKDDSSKAWLVSLLTYLFSSLSIWTDSQKNKTSNDIEYNYNQKCPNRLVSLRYFVVCILELHTVIRIFFPIQLEKWFKFLQFFCLLHSLGRTAKFWLFFTSKKCLQSFFSIIIQLNKSSF